MGNLFCDGHGRVRRFSSSGEYRRMQTRLPCLLQQTREQRQTQPGYGDIVWLAEMNEVGVIDDQSKRTSLNSQRGTLAALCLL